MTRKQKRLAIYSFAAMAFFALLIAVGVRGSRMNVASTTQVAAAEASSLAAVAPTLATTTGSSMKPLGQVVATSTPEAAKTSSPPFSSSTSSVAHIKTPDVVRTAYMTACYASQKNLRQHVVDVIEKTKLNSVIIDVKDFTGYVSFDTGDARFSYAKAPCKVSDMKEFLKELGDKHIYRIARVTVMQDPKYASEHASSAVQWKTGGVWKDKKGLAFIDPADREFWAYIRDLSKASYDSGFDEINFDYVRFPTDGNLKNAAFPLSEKIAHDIYEDVTTPAVTKVVTRKDPKTHVTSTSTVVVTPAKTTHKLVATMKAQVMKSFYEYIGGEMKKAGIPTSVDLFGLVTTTHDDLGIGQVLENAMPNFDYVAPMVYPSHYPKGAFGYSNPNHFPGEVIDKAMQGAVARAKAQGFGPEKFRTWIQDFNYGGIYGVPEITAEIRASEKNGIMSYMVWDPKNKYTQGAYD